MDIRPTYRECSSVVEYLPCLGETLTSVSSPEKIEKKRKKWKQSWRERQELWSRRRRNCLPWDLVCLPQCLRVKGLQSNRPNQDYHRDSGACSPKDIRQECCKPQMCKRDQSVPYFDFLHISVPLLPPDLNRSPQKASCLIISFFKKKISWVVKVAQRLPLWCLSPSLTTWV